MDYYIDDSDRAIIREAAKRQLELASTDKNKDRIKQWYQHNECKGEKPLAYIEIVTFADEVLPGRLLCEGEFARYLETCIRSNYLNQELFDDDFVTPDHFPLKYDRTFRLFDIDVEKTHADINDGKGIGHRFFPTITDLEADGDKLKPSVFGVDMDNTLKKKAVIEEVIGDILPVRVNMGCLYSVPTQMIVHIMGMENMLCNMVENPELFMDMMERIANDTLAYFDMLEKQGFVLPTVGHDDLGNGSLCYTHDLPGAQAATNRSLTTHDVWGFMDSQETVPVSPKMFEKMVFPCYEKIASRFGLLSYGCCEPVDPIWENCLSKLPNLRKLSISPWANEELMGQCLAGSKVIYFRKPRPHFLGVDRVLNEDGLREDIRKTLNAARGCKIEFAQRDVYTIHHDIGKAKRYIEVIREEIEDHWKG